MIYKGRKVLDGTLESIQDAYGSDTCACISTATGNWTACRAWSK